MKTYTARLDKGGRRILCGKLDCGQDIGSVEEIPDPEHPDSVRRLAMLSPGWEAVSETTWVMTEHAKKRILRGQRPLARRRTNVLNELPGLSNDGVRSGLPVWPRSA